MVGTLPLFSRLKKQPPLTRPNFFTGAFHHLHRRARCHRSKALGRRRAVRRRSGGRGSAVRFLVRQWGMIFHDLGLSENSVPLNPLDYHHFPYQNSYLGVYYIFRHTHLEVSEVMRPNHSKLHVYIYIMYRIDHLSIESYKLEKKAAHVRLERHPAKIQKVKSQKVYFLTFRLFFFPLTFSTFRLFFFPLDSQRFKFCTFSCTCSAGKASGRNSNS